MTEVHETLLRLYPIRSLLRELAGEMAVSDARYQRISRELFAVEAWIRELEGES